MTPFLIPFFDSGEPSDAVGINPQWTWNTIYLGVVGLRVTDAEGEFEPCSDIDYTTIEIGNHAPISDPDGPYLAPPGTTIILDGTGSYDPDPVDTITYEWDLDNNGLFDDSTNPTPEFTVGDRPGTLYDICLRVTDMSGETDVACTTVQIRILQPELWPDEYRWGEPAPGYSYAAMPIFESWMEVHFVNIGPGDAYNITATITCTPLNTVATDETVTLGNIPAGSEAWSSDIFTLEVDMSNPQDPDRGICWRVEYDDVAGNHHVIENVAKFCGEECNNICP